MMRSRIGVPLTMLLWLGLVARPIYAAPASSSSWGQLLDPAYDFPALYSPKDCLGCFNGDERFEPAVVDPRKFDPSTMLACNSPLSPDDIYTGLLWVLISIENIFRRQQCDPRRFQIDQMPVIVGSMLSRLQALPYIQLRQNPIAASFIDSMSASIRVLLQKAEDCQLDFVLLMKVIRMSLKMLINRIICGHIELKPPPYPYGSPWGIPPNAGPIWMANQQYPDWRGYFFGNSSQSGSPLDPNTIPASPYYYPYYMASLPYQASPLPPYWYYPNPNGLSPCEQASNVIKPA